MIYCCRYDPLAVLAKSAIRSVSSVSSNDLQQKDGHVLGYVYSTDTFSGYFKTNDIKCYFKTNILSGYLQHMHFRITI